MDTLRNLPTDAPANLASLIDIREGLSNHADGFWFW